MSPTPANPNPPSPYLLSTWEIFSLKYDESDMNMAIQDSHLNYGLHVRQKCGFKVVDPQAPRTTDIRWSEQHKRLQNQNQNPLSTSTPLWVHVYNVRWWRLNVRPKSDNVSRPSKEKHLPMPTMIPIPEKGSSSSSGPLEVGITNGVCYIFMWCLSWAK